jgi:hypothetical protein
MASVNPGSSFVRVATKAGFSYDQLINRIVEIAIERYAQEAPDFFSPINNTNKR